MWTNLYSENIKTGVLLHPISLHLPALTCYHTNQIKHKLDNKIKTFDQVNIKKFQKKLKEIDITLILQETISIQPFVCLFMNTFLFFIDVSLW